MTFQCTKLLAVYKSSNLYLFLLKYVFCGGGEAVRQLHSLAHMIDTLLGHGERCDG